ncbi:MAG: diphosphomevalonate decarboxylase [Oligoflexus sp.]
MSSGKYYKATAPSNIAFIKYWGKQDEKLQWPANSSLSMSLDQLHSETRAQVLNDASEHQVFLNGKALQADAGPGKKVFQHLDFLASRYQDELPKLAIHSVNHFPTGCGIASSASGLAALTIAALAAWLQVEDLDGFSQHDISREQLAHLARQGSGSAGRSLWGGFVRWAPGANPNAQELTPVYPAEQWALRDTVVLFSEQEKKTSSTDAHRLAWTSPLFLPRLAAIDDRLRRVEQAIQERCIDTLGELIELDCLEMHGVIMSANPPVHYFDQETASFLAWIRKIRKQEGLRVYFTLDAGANVHLIYEDCEHGKLMQILESKFPASHLLCDQVGRGPTLRVEVDE